MQRPVAVHRDGTIYLFERTIQTAKLARAGSVRRIGESPEGIISG